MNEVFFSFSQITYIWGGLSDDFLNIIIIIIPSVVVMRTFPILDKAGEGEKKVKIFLLLCGGFCLTELTILFVRSSKPHKQLVTEMGGQRVEISCCDSPSYINL